MISEKMDESKLEEIISTFANYVEDYYDEEDEPADVSSIVNDKFIEFIDWAYDDFVINEGEREAIKKGNDQETGEKIRNEVIGAFLMILEEKES